MSDEVIQDVNGVNWLIIEYHDGWRWKSTDDTGVENESEKRFDTKEECKADAKVNGMGEENLVAKLGRGHKIEEE